ncbi:MAG: hypothetical protein HY079_09760 [Elusimicrobia bacterium]|nr:hypothetical protein [Elusimicrobiota bacterium]
MTDGGPRLALLARLSEATTWDDAVRRHETDPWSYLRRKLDAAAGPLAEFKRALFEDARRRLLDDLSKPMLPPGSLETHRESFEALLSVGDFADLSFHLDPGAERRARLDGARSVLAHAKVLTAFDHEALPPDKRSRAWEKRVGEMTRRLGFDALETIVRRGENTAAFRARAARRVRRDLGEYITVARGSGVLRDEVTPFMLGRIEAAVAAARRVLALLP